MADPIVSTNATLATAQSTFSTPKTASSKDARRVFGKSMQDITKAVEEARGMKPSGQVGAPSAEATPKATTLPQDASSAPDAPEAETAPESDPETPREATPDPLRAREAKLVERQQAFTRREREFDTRMRQVETELAAAREINRMSQADPLGYFEKYHGIRKEAFVEVLGKQATAATAAPGTTAALPPEVTRELEDGRNFRQQLERERQERRIVDEQENFARQAREGNTRWPLSSRFSAEKLKARGWDIAVAHARQGVTLSNEEVLDKLEDELSEVASLMKPQGSQKQSGGSAVGQTGTAARTSSQPTLSARGASEPNPPTKPFFNPLARDRISNGVRVVEELLKKKA